MQNTKMQNTSAYYSTEFTKVLKRRMILAPGALGMQEKSFLTLKQ
jgi:hypothetical protein